MTSIERAAAAELLLKRMRAVTDAYRIKNGKSWTMDEQLLKIYEEVGEAHYSWHKQMPGWNTVQETADIILASITLLQIIGCSDNEIAWAIEECLEKCEKRVGLSSAATENEEK